MKRFKKAYIEISNICNLSCSFCHGTKRTPRLMSVAEFDCVTDRLMGYTEHLYFHLLGEPLLHPDLAELMHIAAEKGFYCCLTTNGTLLREKADILLNAERLKKLSVSLHSFEANRASVPPETYLEDVWSVCVRLADKGVICVLRLWNDGGADTLNPAILGFLRSKTGREPEKARRGYLIRENIFLENAAKFDWPDSDAPVQDVRFCYGLRDQIGVLCDGTVVPCCLDAEGDIALGNILTQSLREILSEDRAVQIYDGFSSGKPSEELCKRCGFASRFNK